jgi:hypothetical protein
MKTAQYRWLCSIAFPPQCPSESSSIGQADCQTESGLSYLNGFATRVSKKEVISHRQALRIAAIKKPPAVGPMQPRGGETGERSCTTRLDVK